ncbi:MULTISPECIES: hypothetical protein [unclassified Lysinibacillus]|uniref:hypothetical protein n=1 Tax=unclassified Lysinibacillus TaxID=2636778 RepID=UPI00148247CE|nr:MULTISPECIES: hypothetical protein [unclassified Lysinibacillus]
MADNYNFIEEAANIIIKFHDFNLKHYSNRFAKDDGQLRDTLLKVYVVETEIGILMKKY